MVQCLTSVFPMRHSPQQLSRNRTLTDRSAIRTRLRALSNQWNNLIVGE